MEEMKKIFVPALLWSYRNKEAVTQDIIATTRVNIKVAYKHVMVCDIMNGKFFNIKKI